MSIEIDKAKLLYNLLRRKKIGGNYDRLEHLKRFDKKAINDLFKQGLLISPAKKKFITISVNPRKVEEAKEFVRNTLPELKGI